MPRLEWIGKDKVINHHQHVPFHVLHHIYGFTAEQGKADEETGIGDNGFPTGFYTKPLLRGIKAKEMKTKDAEE